MYVLLWLRFTKGDAAEIPCFAIIIVVPRVGYYNCDCQAEMVVTGQIFFNFWVGHFCKDGLVQKLGRVLIIWLRRAQRWRLDSGK